MTYRTVSFPQYPEYTVFIGYYTGLSPETLTKVKSQVIQRNEQYNYCFLSTTHLVSLEQLFSSLHKAIQNNVQGTMKANTLNTEILFNLSPVNNINEALKRFGIDEKRLDVVVIKVVQEAADFEEQDLAIAALLETNKNAELSNELLMEVVDIKKFTKLFKIQTAGTQAMYTREAIAASLLRGL